MKAIVCFLVSCALTFGALAALQPQSHARQANPPRCRAIVAVDDLGLCPGCDIKFNLMKFAAIDCGGCGITGSVDVTCGAVTVNIPVFEFAQCGGGVVKPIPCVGPPVGPWKELVLLCTPCP